MVSAFTGFLLRFLVPDWLIDLSYTERGGL